MKNLASSVYGGLGALGSLPLDSGHEFIRSRSSLPDVWPDPLAIETDTLVRTAAEVDSDGPELVVPKLAGTAALSKAEISMTLRALRELSYQSAGAASESVMMTGRYLYAYTNNRKPCKPKVLPNEVLEQETVYSAPGPWRL